MQLRPNFSLLKAFRRPLKCLSEVFTRSLKGLLKTFKQPLTGLSNTFFAKKKSFSMHGAVGICSPPPPPETMLGASRRSRANGKQFVFRNVTRLPKRYINIVIGGGGGAPGWRGVDAKNRYFRKHRSHVVRAATL